MSTVFSDSLRPLIFAVCLQNSFSYIYIGFENMYRLHNEAAALG